MLRRQGAKVRLRPYQRDAIDAVRRDWADGYKSVLGMAATGTGKTVVMLALLTEVLGEGQRGLILSHRQELVFQPIERLYQFWPSWRGRAGAVMGSYDERDRDIISATVQTLSSGNRLEKVLFHGAFDYVIVDESHHACSETYLSVLEKLREANPDMRCLGVTATPIRSDGKSLGLVFEKESFHYDIRKMIGWGYLAPPRWLAIQTGISVAGVASRNGDFVGKQLADVYETDNCFELVAESHRKYAMGRQGMAFTESVDGAYRLAEAFRKAGVRAEAADGTTKKDQRQGILDRFRAGKIDVLCNVGIWTEGLDLPQISVLHMVRPTKSDGLYIQCVGRGLRLAPGKEDCLVLDYAPLEARNICMLGDVLGVDARKDVYITQDEDTEPGDVIGGFTFNGKETKWLTGNPMEIVSRQLDYLDASPFSWHRNQGDGWLTLGLGEVAGVERTLAISQPDSDGKCWLWLVRREENAWGYRQDNAEIIKYATFEEISEDTEEWIAEYGNAALIGKKKAWRKQPASVAQIRFAQKLGVWEDGISKGECAERITHKLAVRAVERARKRGYQRSYLTTSQALSVA